MAYDAPSLRGYTFSKPPDKYEIWWERISEKNTLSDGTMRQYIKGYKLRFKFGWGNNWLNEDDFSNLCTIYNDQSAVALIPRPTTYPSKTFTVQLTNTMEFKPWKDLLAGTGFQAFEGVLEGEGFYLTATASREW